MADGTDSGRGPSYTEDAWRSRAESLRRRRRGYVLVAMVLLFGLIAWGAWELGLGTEPLLQAEHDIGRGEVIDAGDVKDVWMRAGRVPADLLAARRGDVVGHLAKVPIQRGALLDMSDVGGRPRLDEGHVAMAMTLRQDQAGGGLPGTGDNVLVLLNAATAAPGAQPAPPDGGSVRATVIAVGRSGNDGLLVTLAVPRADAPAVASAYAARSVQLALLP